ncbi:hypothetical protein HDU76_006978, partial [Blyttiomyces sp. JEL0837]
GFLRKSYHWWISYPCIGVPDVCNFIFNGFAFYLFYDYDNYLRYQVNATYAFPTNYHVLSHNHAHYQWRRDVDETATVMTFDDDVNVPVATNDGKVFVVYQDNFDWISDNVTFFRHTLIDKGAFYFCRAFVDGVWYVGETNKFMDVCNINADGKFLYVKKSDPSVAMQGSSYSNDKKHQPFTHAIPHQQQQQVVIVQQSFGLPPPLGIIPTFSQTQPPTPPQLAQLQQSLVQKYDKTSHMHRREFSTFEIHPIEISFVPNAVNGDSFIGRDGFNGLDAHAPWNIQGFMGLKNTTTNVISVGQVLFRITVSLGGFRAGKHMVGQWQGQGQVAEVPVQSIVSDFSVVMPIQSIQLGQVTAIAVTLIVGGNPNDNALLPFNLTYTSTLPPSFDSSQKHWTSSYCRYRLTGTVISPYEHHTDHWDIPVPIYDSPTIKSLLSSTTIHELSSTNNGLIIKVFFEGGVIGPHEQISFKVTAKRQDGKQFRVSQIHLKILEHFDHVDPAPNHIVPRGEPVVDSLIDYNKEPVHPAADYEFNTTVTVTTPPQSPQPPLNRLSSALRNSMNLDGSWGFMKIRHRLWVGIVHKGVGLGGLVSSEAVMEADLKVGGCGVLGCQRLLQRNPGLVDLLTERLPAYREE